MPTFLPLFATDCTTFCQPNVPLKKYPITTVIQGGHGILLRGSEKAPLKNNKSLDPFFKNESKDVSFIRLKSIIKQ
jgi:hypothetical protein